MACEIAMPYQTLYAYLRARLSLPRLLALLVLWYVMVWAVIPRLVAAGIPFESRIIFLCIGPVLGAVFGPWLYPKRR